MRGQVTITGPESISMHEVAKSLSKAIGRTISYVDVPPQAVQEGMLAFGMGEWLVDEYLQYYEVFKNNQANFTSDDFENVMGRKPRSIDDFARDFVGVFDPSKAQPAPAG